MSAGVPQNNQNWTDFSEHPDRDGSKAMNDSSRRQGGFNPADDLATGGRGGYRDTNTNFDQDVGSGRSGFSQSNQTASGGSGYNALDNNATGGGGYNTADSNVTGRGGYNASDNLAGRGAGGYGGDDDMTASGGYGRAGQTGGGYGQDNMKGNTTDIGTPGAGGDFAGNNDDDMGGSAGGAGAKPSFGDRLKGTMEKATGKMTGNKGKVERGQERKEGEFTDSNY